MGGWKKTPLAAIQAPQKWAMNGGPFGSKLTQKDYADHGVPVIRGANLSGDSRFSGEGFVFVSEAKAEELRANIAVPGDVVFTQRGTLGDVGVVPSGAYERYVISQSQMKISVDRKVSDPRFIYYVFKSPRAREEIKGLASTSGVPHINLTVLREFEVPHPPLSSQRRIADVLSAYDDLIENNQKRIGILEEMIDCVWLRYASGCSFEMMTLGEIADRSGGTIRTGPFGSQLHESDYTENGTPVVMPMNIIAGRLREYGIARIPDDVIQRVSQHRMIEGDIVYGRRGDIGRRAYIGPRQVGWVCGTGCLRISIPASIVHPRYVYAWLGRPSVVAAIAAKAVGATMPNLNTSILREVSIEVPSLDAQENFVKFASVCDEEIDCLELKIATLRATRDLLLPRLISGELDVSRVPDPVSP